MPAILFLLWLLTGQAAAPPTACEAALAAGVGPGSAEACQGDQARQAADTARGPAAERARQLADAVEHYERAANLLTNPSAKVPGTPMAGILPDPQQRANVIAFLSTLKE